MPRLNAKDKNPAGLSPKEELFCSEYVANGFNASKAARSAGYSAKTSDSMGSQLLSKIRVKNRVDELKAAVLKKNEITAEEVVRRLAVVARSDVKNMLTFDGDHLEFKSLEEMGDQTESIESIKRKIRREAGKKEDDPDMEEEEIEMHFRDKLKALDCLAKYFKLYADTPPPDPNAKNTTIIMLPRNGFEPKPRTGK